MHFQPAGNNDNNLQAFQLVVLARCLIGVTLSPFRVAFLELLLGVDGLWLLAKSPDRTS